MSQPQTSMSPESKSLLRCIDLGRTVRGTRILEAVSLDVARGDLVLITGPSGAGKTSLLRLIAGLDRPSSGAIEIGGREVSGPGRNIAPARRGVGLVFEQAALWPHLTVEQHLALVLKGAALKAAERRKRIDALLERVHLAPLRRRFPHQLSAGERQRAALARSLALSPQILLLDEPLARLDVHLAADLAQLLLGLHRREGLTTLCVMHRPEGVNTAATPYVVLEKGRVAQQGKEAEVFQSPQTPFVAALAKALGYGGTE